MTKIIALVLGLTFLSGCVLTSKGLTPKERRVKLSKVEPSGTCSELGDLRSDEYNALIDQCGHPEAIYSCLRRNAARKGGNYVVMDIFRPGGILGRLYMCREE